MSRIFGSESSSESVGVHDSSYLGLVLVDDQFSRSGLMSRPGLISTCCSYGGSCMGCIGRLLEITHLTTKVGGVASWCMGSSRS